MMKPEKIDRLIMPIIISLWGISASQQVVDDSLAIVPYATTLHSIMIRVWAEAQQNLHNMDLDEMDSEQSQEVPPHISQDVGSVPGNVRKGTLCPFH